jgi:hypothetical protein
MLIRIGKNFKEIAGLTDRDVAHNEGDWHFTVLTIFYITDGKDKGKLLVHDRAARQKAKGKGDKTEYNLSASGHCEISDKITKEKVEALKGHKYNHPMVKEQIFDPTFDKEFSEEVFLADTNGNVKLQGYDGNVKECDKLTPVFLGFVRFSGKGSDGINNEISAVYGIPVDEDTANNLIFADDDGKGNDIYLKKEFFSLDYLRELYDNQPELLCDAISRLFTDENRHIFDYLLATGKIS